MEHTFRSNIKAEWKTQVVREAEEPYTTSAQLPQMIMSREYYIDGPPRPQASPTGRILVFLYPITSATNDPQIYRYHAANEVTAGQGPPETVLS